MANQRGKTLHDACLFHEIERVKLLLQQNGNIDSGNKKGNRPLHLACKNGDIVIFKLLLEHKCNIDACNKKGKRPVHYACQYGHIEIVKLLLERKCNVDVSNKNGKRPLHFACQNGYIEIFKLLLENKCDVDVSNKNGNRPVHFACKNGHIEIVKLLLEHKCDIDASNNKRKRSMHFACQNGHIEIVKLLLEHKCNFIDCYDELVTIANNKSHEIIDLLDAARKNHLMCTIALAMSFECRTDCAHRSCFISMSVEDWKKDNNLIESGAYGEVYKCSHLEFSFALKIIKTNDHTKNIEENLEIYRNILKHDHIVQYFGSITEPHHITIFMEYMAGESLYDQIKDHGAIPHDTIAKYSKQILLGISFLHQKKIIHRDIKPQNMLLDLERKTLKLCDFGLSRSLMTISTVTTQNANTFCGTPNYLAPEVIKEEPYSFRADIWSIGVTMVEMLTGHPPFHNLNPFAVILKISQLTTLEFTPVQPMSDDLNSFVDQMLQCDPSKRATAAQLLECKFINPTSSKDIL